MDYRWLKRYERSRHSSKRQPNKSWASSKYDFTDPNVRLEYVPEMSCSVGGCISALKKLWKSYKICGRTGEPRSDIAWNIRNLQGSLGLIERSNFPELEGEGMDNENEDRELTDEELQLKREEQESSGAGEPSLNLNSGTSADTAGWSEEDKQLRKEEREDEDEWWLS